MLASEEKFNVDTGKPTMLLSHIMVIKSSFPSITLALSITDIACDTKYLEFVQGTAIEYNVDKRMVSILFSFY